jgi:hypothetical protein
VSLYGTGRSEGVASVLLVGVLVLCARAIGAWSGGEAPWQPALAPAAFCAFGGMACYRLVRALGRSRYAGFLVGAGYGLSPWLLAMANAPREQVAAALAPLALEAVRRCAHPAHRTRWLPWAWIAMASPFAAGPTVVGALAAALCCASLAATLLWGERDDERPTARNVAITGALAIVAAANLAWLQPFAAWLQPTDALPATWVLAAHRPLEAGFDVAAVLRVPGPALLTFALLGVLRRQRHVALRVWGPMALAGGLPTLVLAVPFLAHALPAWPALPLLATGAWWLTLLGVAVLAAAGLDDFLDLPLRRRTALPWLLALAVACAPWLPLFGSRSPDGEWPLTATFVALPLVLTAWRQLGILRFKNWLAVVALVALAIPMIQVRTVAPPAIVAMPLGETAPPSRWAPLAQLARRPVWHYAGLLVALAGGCLLAASAWRRNRHASKPPKAANAAIVKKARPAQRS